MDDTRPRGNGKEKIPGQIVSVRGSVVDIEFLETLPPFIRSFGPVKMVKS